MALNLNLIQSCLVVFVILMTSRLTVAVEMELGQVEKTPKDLYGFNCNLLMAIAFEGVTTGGVEMENAIADLKPAGLRFPGGTIANNYLWQKDSFSEQKDDLTQWAGKQIDLFRKMGKPYDLPGYIRQCRQYQLNPIWVLNIYEETPESAVALMEKLAGMRLKVKMVEMGNEPYWDPRSLNNVDIYSQYCRPLAQALKQYDPALAIGACFGPLQNEPYNYRDKWNSILASQDWYDAIIFHDYYGGQGFVLEKGAKLPSEALLHPEPFIDDPVEELTQLVPNKPIWLTEWNIGSEGVKQWKNTGAELLFLGVVFNRLFEHRHSVSCSVFHQIYDSHFGTFYYDKESGTIKTMASYQFFRLMGKALANTEYFRTARFDDADISGFVTIASDGHRLFLVNRGAKSQAIHLPNEFNGVLKRIWIDCPPEKNLGAIEDAIQITELTGREAVVPSYSICLIAPSSVLIDTPDRERKKNLFPTRPYLTLWYPPYASQQPRVDERGVYTLSFAGLTDKPMAIVKINLNGLGLKAGACCRLTFQARAEPPDTLIINLPEQAIDRDEALSVWLPLTQQDRIIQKTFIYDPNLNQGEVSFFFEQKTIARGGKYVFGDFKISVLE